MTTPTTAPIPSSSAADLLFNAQKLDQAVTGDTTYYTDRFGVQRFTVRGATDSIKSITVRGDWATGVAYVGKDVVKFSGTWYICVEAHTSSATFAADAARWRVYQGITSAELIAADGAAKVGYKASSVDAAVRTLLDKEKERGFSILDFGAVPDGTASAGGTPTGGSVVKAILAAWNAANTIGVADYGGVVYVPAGLYTLSPNEAAVIPPMIKLKGDGKYLSQFVVPTNFNAVTDISADRAASAIKAEVTYRITSLGTTNWASIGAGSSPAVGTVFTATGAGSGTGTARVCVRAAIVTDSTFAPYNGAPDFPCFIEGIGVVAASGGTALPVTGIYANKNATFISDVWVNGFTAGNGVVLASTDQFIHDWAAEYCDYGVVAVLQHINIGAGTAFLCGDGVLVRNAYGPYVPETQGGHVHITDVRANNCARRGFYVYQARRVKLSNCSVNHTDGSQFNNGGILIDSSLDVTVANPSIVATINAASPATDRDGLIVNNSALVSVNGGHIVSWRKGIVQTGGNNVLFCGVQSYGHFVKGAELNGGDQIQILGGIYSTNGSAAANDCAIESNNTGANSTHSILGATCQQPIGGTQDYGVRAFVADNGNNTGQTYISGGTNALYNSVAPYLLTGRVDRIFTQGSYPVTRTPQTVASAATLTIPASASDGDMVTVTGTTNITSITAAGFAGCTVTLLFQGVLTVVNGSNIKIGSSFATSANATLTLKCDGTNWVQISRSTN